MTKTQSQTLRFIHRFSRTLQCELHIAAQPPRPGQMLSLACLWTGKPKKKHIPADRQWVLVTNQHLTDHWGIRISYGLGVSPNQTEFWSFEPGGSPKLLKKLNVGIP